MTSANGVDPRDVPVVIFCGGMGTRLREASEKLPKPLVDIGGRPVLWHIMKTYGAYGFRKFVLCLGYKGDLIKDYFLNYRMLSSDFTLQLNGDHKVEYLTSGQEEDWEITFAETGLQTSTATRLAKVEQYLGDAKHLAITYGDGVGAVELDKAFAAYLDRGVLGQVTGVHPTSRYGEMNVTDDMVGEFNEKPTMAEGWVNGGYFFFAREFVNSYCDKDRDEMLEAGPLRQLARDGGLGVFEHNGFWMGMDTYRDWTELNKIWDANEAEWKVWKD